MRVNDQKEQLASRKEVYRSEMRAAFLPQVFLFPMRSLSVCCRFLFIG